MARVHQRAREVRPPQVLAAARGDHAVHRHAGEPGAARQRDHALHPLAPLREHAGGEPPQRGRPRVDEVPEHVDLAAMQIAGELDPGNEADAGLL